MSEDENRDYELFLEKTRREEEERERVRVREVMEAQRRRREFNMDPFRRMM
jgi:hypothetical protein